MSVPILYKASETDFSTMGLGPLRDASSALVTEERNGLFELEMTYPVDGIMLSELKNDRLIKVDASPLLKDQRFKIIRVTTPAKGVVTVNAEHVSYLTQDLPLEPEVNYSGTATSALNTWRSNIVDDHPFSVYSDISTIGSGSWTIQEVENARRALGGVQGSILDTYRGEYRFDNYHISLLKARGSDTGALIAYGKNLTDLEQEEEIASTYTSIYPYVVLDNEDVTSEIVSLPERFIDSEYVGNFARRKILVVDFSGDFSEDEVATEGALRERAERYIKDNDVGIPTINLRVSYSDLSKTLEYRDLQLVEQSNLCDYVTIDFDKLDIRRKAKIIKVIWNALLDRYEEIELGESRASLSESISVTVDNRLEPVESRLNTVQVAANGKNTIFRGPDTPVARKVGDLWYKPVGDGEVEMLQWDGATWKMVVSTAVNNEIDSRIKEAKASAEEARGIAEDAYDRVQKAIDNAEEAYEYADSALDSANGKNTVYRGKSKPTDGESGDIWFRETADGWITHVHNGTDFEESTLDGKSIAGVINFGDVTALNFDANAITTGNIQIDRGLKVVNNGQDVLKVENGNVVMDVDNLLIESSVGGAGFDKQVNTAIYQDNQAIGLIYEENGETKSLIHLGPEGPYLSGENIILNGDTIVNGSFTVTDEIFAENMNISKFTVGTLNGANVNLINLNADNIVTGTIRSQVLQNSGIATFGDVGDVQEELVESLMIKDTRDDNRSPTWYYENYPKQKVREFKRLATLGFSGGSTYGTLETVIPWSDASGGSVKQSFVIADKIHTRSGEGSSWGSWKESPNTNELATSGQTVINGGNITTGKIQDRNNNTEFDLANGNLRFNHSDGSYTRIGRDGLRRHTSGDNRNYHYLISIHTFIYGESSNNARWIQLPNDFKGKQFKVYMALADSMSVANYNRVLQRLVATQHPNHSIDHKNARVPVIAYKSESLGDGVAPNISNVQGMLIAIY